MILAPIFILPDIHRMDDKLKNILVGAGLERIIGGFSKQSGFIRRLMAENTVAHRGQYGNPTTLHPKSTMNEPAIFKYKKLATPAQQGTKQYGNPYGASPFIQRHFGTIERVPFVRKFGAPYPTEPFEKPKKGRKAKTAKPQRQLTAEEEDLLAPVGFEPEAAAPTFQAPQAGPELQHPELERPAKAKKPPKPPAGETEAEWELRKWAETLEQEEKKKSPPPASNSSASDPYYYRKQDSARKATEAQRAIRAAHSDERTEEFDADVKKFSKNRLFVIATCWLEHEKGKDLNAKEMMDVENLIDKGGYPEIFSSGAFFNGNANWGAAFPFLKEGGKKSEAVEKRENFLQSLYLQNPKFGKVITMNPFGVKTVYTEGEGWEIFVGRDGQGYDKKTREDYNFPEWAGPFSSWADFENGDRKWVSQKYWEENMDYRRGTPFQKRRA